MRCIANEWRSLAELVAVRRPLRLKASRFSAACAKIVKRRLNNLWGRQWRRTGWKLPMTGTPRVQAAYARPRSRQNATHGFFPVAVTIANGVQGPYW